MLLERFEDSFVRAASMIGGDDQFLFPTNGIMIVDVSGMILIF